MGNLLIVDDEPDILESLEEMFKYESGLDIDVYVAKSATNAVKLLEKIKFDVVMTDIKMPGMNGIDLFKLIKENWPKCRVIFLTGYRDFDNLYEISGYKDVRYLLKSEEDEVLISAVADAFEEIDKMMQSEMQESEHQSEIKKAQNVLRKNVMREFFHNTAAANVTQEELNRIKIPLRFDKDLFIFLLRADNFEENISFEEETEREVALCEIIEEFLPPRISYYLYYDINGYYLLFLQPVRFPEDSLSARTWMRLYTNLAGAMEYVQEKAFILFSLSLSFVTCDERCRLRDGQSYLNRLKQEASDRIGNNVQRTIMAESAPLASGLLEDNAPVNLQLQVKRLEEALETKKFRDFMTRLQQLTDVLCVEDKKDTLKATELYYSIAILLLRYININHIKNKIGSDYPLDKLIYVEKHAGMREAANYLQAVAGAIADEMDAERKSRTNDVLEKVLLYIDNHLAEDLTLTRLAEISYLNASYLSRIFKQRYGCNITEYISNARLEKAKKLLTTTACKINEISVRVGYLTAPSFTRVFKKSVGISPVEYRDRYGEKNNDI